MPRYFFNAEDGHFDRDVTGCDLPHHYAARVEAIRRTGALLMRDPDYLWSGGDFRIEVTDRDGKHLFTVLSLVFDTEEARANPAKRHR